MAQTNAAVGLAQDTQELIQGTQELVEDIGEGTVDFVEGVVAETGRSLGETFKIFEIFDSETRQDSV